MDNEDDYPRIETTERGYREFLRTHPRREHLRRVDLKNISLAVTVIYDFEKFSADMSHCKMESRFAVATRTFDPATNTYVFHILPNGSQLIW